MNHDQYEIEAVATEAWASRQKCIVNTEMPHCPRRQVKHGEISLLATDIKDALYAYYCMDAVEPCRVRMYRVGGDEGSVTG